MFKNWSLIFTKKQRRAFTQHRGTFSYEKRQPKKPQTLDMQQLWKLGIQICRKVVAKYVTVHLLL